ncbi:hypothetical protein [Stenoxybacter acetivorans]|uniref:hypothetical protein n=1 Tax=Stenoxybacter acetivorans TaxID=422441 RepID=UPI00056AF2F5|nr:hypothetical protein [Stenoxybacter acetivorans]
MSYNLNIFRQYEDDSYNYAGKYGLLDREDAKPVDAFRHAYSSAMVIHIKLISWLLVCWVVHGRLWVMLFLTKNHMIAIWIIGIIKLVEV